MRVLTGDNNKVGGLNPRFGPTPFKQASRSPTATHDRAHVLDRARSRHTHPRLQPAVMPPTTATPPSAVTVPDTATHARRDLVLWCRALVLATLLFLGTAFLALLFASLRRPAPRRALLSSPQASEGAASVYGTGKMVHYEQTVIWNEYLSQIRCSVVY